LDRLVVGLETVAGRAVLGDILGHVGPGRTVFSLDLVGGRALTRYELWQELHPLEIARQVVEIGVEQMIVLDLAEVGTRSGGGDARTLCRALRQEFPELRIVSGGGVRDAADVKVLFDAGCDSVLVASALHDGTLTPETLIGLPVT
jgi:phosphoribosylformimino-5-aminoimidazole carboxamide ribotide isomerase